MNTVFLLMAEFQTTDIPLRDCCDKYFGLELKAAAEKARKQDLPVPVYRGGSQKSQWLVNANDLAKFIDTQRKKAQKDWKRMQPKSAA